MKRLKNDILVNQELLKEFLEIELYKKIINTKAFKRLKNIAFLGAIDYKYNSQKRFYRYEHSINVALLAFYYARLKNFDKKNTDYLVVSALLHDIGHPPLSHSTEFGFKIKYNINHHQMGLDIISGKNQFFGDEIKYILNRYEIDENYICKLLDKKIDNEINFVLNNPINVDTIDGICRTYLTQNYKQKYFYKPFKIIEALVKKEIKILDSFWELKNKMYNEFIHSKDNLLLDEITKEFIIEKKILESEFLANDTQFIKKHNLCLNSTGQINKIIQFKRRKYFVKGIILNSYDDFYENYKVDKYDDEIRYNNYKGYKNAY